LRRAVHLLFRAIPPDSDWRAIMSQLTHPLDSSLLVRHVTGDYRPANVDEVFQAAQPVLAGRMRDCQALNSPQMVRDFLRVKLRALEHEVFAVIHLDAQNRLR
jgi:DNA repair protein RadC